MTSKQRRQLRRHNATGPVTPEGKAVSSQNAVTHGLTGRQPVLPYENQIEFDRVHQRFVAQLKPASEHQHCLVQVVASACWRLRRLDRIEAASLDLLTHPDASSQSPDHQIAASMGNTPGEIADKILRHRNAAERSYHRAFREFLAAALSLETPAAFSSAESPAHLPAPEKTTASHELAPICKTNSPASPYPAPSAAPPLDRPAPEHLSATPGRHAIPPDCPLAGPQVPVTPGLKY